MNRPVGQTGERGDALLSAARDQINFIRETREKGDLTEIEPSTIQELMCCLIPLANSNQAASTLEDLCAGAIFAYNKREYDNYVRYLKKIIEIGKSL